MMKALKKGDIVRTNGGIRGEITAIDERDVTLEIAERTRIKVLRSHIAGLDQPAEQKS
jgi:preprotein translocase subunit YajC